jgi:hypothetical protein
MAWNAPVLLAKWVDHYGSAFGRENLFVVSHGEDAAQRAAAEGCTLIVVPRAMRGDTEAARWRFMGHVFSALAEAFHTVVGGDVDELVALHPDAGPRLADYLLARSAPVVAPLGLEVIPPAGVPPPRIDWRRPILAQMPRVVPRSHYSKPCVVSGPVIFGGGGHGLTEGQDFRLDPNLLLFHLKFADARMWKGHYATLRGDVPRADATGRPGGRLALARGLRFMMQRLARTIELPDDPGGLPAAVARIGPVADWGPPGHVQRRVEHRPEAELPFVMPEALRGLV